MMSGCCTHNCAFVFEWHFVFGDVHLGHHNPLILNLRPSPR
jgi:hypothetical protein